MTTIAFRVHGEPAPQGSKRHVGKGRMIESSKKLPAWRKAVTDAARQAAPKQPLDCPVSVQATFWVPKPQKPRFNTPATQQGDADKLARSLLDGMEKGGIFTNDARVVHLEVEKRYAIDCEPGAEVIVKTLHDVV